MGELIDLQKYREKKEAEEIQQLQEELESLLTEISPKPYWPSEDYSFTYENMGIFSPYRYSFDPDEIGLYYRYDAIFSDEELLEWWSGVIDEANDIDERPAGEIEPDGS